MADRFLVWLGAEMVTAAVAAEMVAGAGVAVADSPPASDAKGTTSAESAKQAENKADSDTDSVGTPKPKPSDKKPQKDAPAEPKGPDETDAARRRPNRGDDGAARPAAGQRASGHQEVGADRIGNRGKGCDKPATPVAIARKPVATPTAKQEPEEPNLQEYKADTKTTVKPLAPILPRTVRSPCAVPRCA